MPINLAQGKEFLARSNHMAYCGTFVCPSIDGCTCGLSDLQRLVSSLEKLERTPISLAGVLNDEVFR